MTDDGLAFQLTSHTRHVPERHLCPHHFRLALTLPSPLPLTPTVMKVVCIDESDLLLKQEKLRPSLEAMLLDRDSAKRRHLLVGASLGKDTMERAMTVGGRSVGWLVTLHRARASRAVGRVGGVVGW